jgi:hypothetical protein
MHLLFTAACKFKSRTPTAIPSLANAIAQARPIPAAAPVINAVLVVIETFPSELEKRDQTEWDDPVNQGPIYCSHQPIVHTNLLFTSTL